MRKLQERANRGRRGRPQGAAGAFDPAAGQERRWTARAAVNSPAALRERQRTRFEVEVLNLSTRGCGVRSARRLKVGGHAWIMLPTLESRYARIAWSAGGLCGLDFEERLHPAVAAMLVRRAHRPCQALDHGQPLP